MPNLIKEKSFDFAVRIVGVSQYLQERKEFVMSKQLLHSGTAVGAMVREAQNAESKKDFIHKLAIAQKEADETIYWIELLVATDYLTPEQAKTLLAEATALLKILRTIILNTKKNMKKLI